MDSGDVVAIRALLDVQDTADTASDIAAAVSAAVDDLSGVTDAATARSNLSVYSQSQVTSAIAAAVADYLIKTGGTLTGFLTLHADPTNVLHAVTKQYVDARSVINGDAHNHDGGDGGTIGHGGVSGLLRDWDSGKSDNTVYQAATDGMVTAVNPAATTGGQLLGITNNSASPTVIRTAIFAETTNAHGISFPVKKDEYWTVTIAGAATVYWLPLGS